MKKWMLAVAIPPLLLSGMTTSSPPSPKKPVPLRVWRAHTAAVTCVRFTSDGKLLATASRDKTAVIWDAATGRKQHTLNGHQGMLSSLSFDPHGVRLATVDWDATLRVWDARSGCLVRTSTDHLPHILAVTFGQKGNLLATIEVRDHPAANRVNHVQVWNVHTGKRESFRNLGYLFTSLCFSPNGRWLAAGDSGGQITIWDVSRGKAVHTLHGNRDWVKSVAFSSDSRRLAVGGSDGAVTVWELVTGKKSFTLEGPSGAVLTLAWSPDSRWLTWTRWRIQDGLGPWAAEVTTWDMASGQTQLLLSLSNPGVRVYDLALSPDGSRLATAYRDGTVRVWPVGQLRKRAAIE